MQGFPRKLPRGLHTWVFMTRGLVSQARLALCSSWPPTLIISAYQGLSR